MRRCTRRTRWPLPLALLLALAPPSRGAAGEIRLIERRVEARQKTEAEVDLPPGCVVTGIGARAHVDNLTTLWVRYREVRADGTLGPEREVRRGEEPDHACEALITLPDGWVAVGFGARGAPEWDVATLRVWGRPWDAARGSPGAELRAWSAGREPEAGLEREVLVEAADRILVGVGLRFHQNDIQGIYARSARALRLPEGDLSLRVVEPGPGVPVVRLRRAALGPVPIAAVDADRLQAELLSLRSRGHSRVAIDPTGVTGTAGAPAIEVARALAADPYRPADAVLRDALARRVGEARADTALRAIGRASLIARHSYSLAGRPFLGPDGLPSPDELPDVGSDDRALRSLEQDRETARWLLIQSRGEVEKLRAAGDTPWLATVAGDLELLARAGDLWLRVGRADILSRRYLFDGAEATRSAARQALEAAAAMDVPPSFGRLAPIHEVIARRLATPAERTGIGREIREIERLSAGPASGEAAERLARLIDTPRFAAALRPHWDTVARLASRIPDFGCDPERLAVRWGGDGRWAVARRGERWSWVTRDEGPCVYVDVAGQPTRVLLRFEVFDDREGEVHVHYNSIDPESGGRSDYRPAPTVAMAGRGGWTTQEVILEECRFIGGQNLAADLRLIPDQRGVALRAIAVEALPAPAPAAPRARPRDRAAR